MMILPLKMMLLPGPRILSLEIAEGGGNSKIRLAAACARNGTGILLAYANPVSSPRDSRDPLQKVDFL